MAPPGPRAVADRQRPPALRPAAAPPRAGRAARLAGALGLRPRGARRPRAARRRPVPDRRLERGSRAAGDPRQEPGRHHGRRAARTARRRRASGPASAASRVRLSPRGPGRVTCGGRCRRPGSTSTSPARGPPRTGRRRWRRAVRSGAVRRRRVADGRRERSRRRMSAVEELTRLDQAVDKAADRLLELQHPGGWWVGELESNATMITEHLFWLHVLGLRDPRDRPPPRERHRSRAAATTAPGRTGGRAPPTSRRRSSRTSR